ncbi:hypothetical protein ACHAWF_005301 [Thalassiosira exigua]
MLSLCHRAQCYTPCHGQHIIVQRRTAWNIICSSVATCTLFSAPPFAYAATPNYEQNAVAGEQDIAILKEATEALTSLLENWQKATVDCTYADVPRELLETKNKDKLLEKASEFALFDKSTSVVSCKRTNRVVRDYIGVTGKGPLVGAEKRLLRSNVVDKIDPESLDDYFSAVESFSSAMSKAASLSYTASVDFDSMNNFAKGEEKGDGSNLGQAREAIEEANEALKAAVSFFTGII